MARYQLPDGTPAFHPLGELLVDRDDDRIRCGLCGRWYRSLGPHLRQTHEWTVTDYRAAFGLNVQRPLEAPGVSERRSQALRRRLTSDPRVRAGMRNGLALARSGTLNELGRRADAERGRALERRRRTEDQGRRIGTQRAARFRAQRNRRARRLGFPDVEALIRQRYLAEQTSLPEIAAALGCAEITLVAETERRAIPRKPQAQRLALGRKALAAQRAEAARAHDTRARELGFDNLPAYLRARHHAQRWPRRLIAEELGVSISVVSKLMQRAAVPALRGVTVAKARH
jgi:hypothetical protein